MRVLIISSLLAFTALSCSTYNSMRDVDCFRLINKQIATLLNKYHPTTFNPEEFELIYTLEKLNKKDEYKINIVKTNFSGNLKELKQLLNEVNYKCVHPVFFESRKDKPSLVAVVFNYLIH